MNITYKPHEVKILTDENWGQTVESNLETISWAAYACHGNEAAFKNPIDVIRKWAFNAGHTSLLEYSNVEMQIGEVEDISNAEVINFRHWQKIIKTWAKGQPFSGIFTGSFRDIIELTGFNIEELMDFLENGKEFLGMPFKFIKIPKNHPDKRLIIFGIDNKDDAHKFRTESRVRQLSLSSTASTKKEEKVFVSYDPESFKDKMEPMIVRNLEICEEAKENLFKYYLNEGMPEKEAKALAHYESKHYINDYYINHRIFVGSVKAVEEMCHKRMLSPRKKRDVHCFSQMILDEVGKWKIS